MLVNFRKNLGIGIAATLLVVNLGAVAPARAAGGPAEEVRRINKGIENDLKRAGFHDKAYHFTMTATSADSPIIKDLIDKHERLQDEVEDLRRDQKDIAERVKEINLQIEVQNGLKGELKGEREKKGFFKEAKERRALHKRENEARDEAKSLTKELAEEVKKMKDIASKINVKTSEYLAVRQTLAKHVSAGNVRRFEGRSGSSSSGGRSGSFGARFDGRAGGGRRGGANHDAGRGRREEFDDTESFEDESFEFEGHADHRASGHHTRFSGRVGGSHGARNDDRIDEFDGRGRRQENFVDHGRRQDGAGGRVGADGHMEFDFDLADLEVRKEETFQKRRRQNGGEAGGGRKNRIDADESAALANNHNFAIEALAGVNGLLNQIDAFGRRHGLSPSQDSYRKHLIQYEEFLSNALRIAKSHFEESGSNRIQDPTLHHNSAKNLNDFFKNIFAYGSAIQLGDAAARDKLLTALNERKEGILHDNLGWEKTKRTAIQVTATAAAGGRVNGVGGAASDEEADDEEFEESHFSTHSSHSSHSHHGHDEGAMCPIPPPGMPGESAAINGTSGLVAEILNHITQNEGKFSDEDMRVLIHAIRILGRGSHQSGAAGGAFGQSASGQHAHSGQNQTASDLSAVLGGAQSAAGGSHADPSLSGLQMKLYVLKDPVADKSYYAVVKGIGPDGRLEVVRQRIGKNDSEGKLITGLVTPEDLEQYYREVPASQLTDGRKRIRNTLLGKNGASGGSASQPVQNPLGVNQAPVIQNPTNQTPGNPTQVGQHALGSQGAQNGSHALFALDDESDHHGDGGEGFVQQAPVAPSQASQNGSHGKNNQKPHSPVVAAPVNPPQLTDVQQALSSLPDTYSVLQIKDAMQNQGFELNKRTLEVRDPHNWRRIAGANSQVLAPQQDDAKVTHSQVNSPSAPPKHALPQNPAVVVLGKIPAELTGDALLARMKALGFRLKAGQVVDRNPSSWERRPLPSTSNSNSVQKPQAHQAQQLTEAELEVQKVLDQEVHEQSMGGLKREMRERGFDYTGANPDDARDPRNWKRKFGKSTHDLLAGMDADEGGEEVEVAVAAPQAPQAPQPSVVPPPPVQAPGVAAPGERKHPKPLPDLVAAQERARQQKQEQAAAKLLADIRARVSPVLTDQRDNFRETGLALNKIHGGADQLGKFLANKSLRPAYRKMLKDLKGILERTPLLPRREALAAFNRKFGLEELETNPQRRKEYFAELKELLKPASVNTKKFLADLGKLTELRKKIMAQMDSDPMAKAQMEPFFDATFGGRTEAMVQALLEKVSPSRFVGGNKTKLVDLKDRLAELHLVDDAKDAQDVISSMKGWK